MAIIVNRLMILNFTNSIYFKQCVIIFINKM